MGSRDLTHSLRKGHKHTQGAGVGTHPHTPSIAELKGVPSSIDTTIIPIEAINSTLKGLSTLAKKTTKGLRTSPRHVQNEHHFQPCKTALLNLSGYCQVAQELLDAIQKNPSPALEQQLLGAVHNALAEAATVEHFKYNQRAIVSLINRKVPDSQERADAGRVLRGYKYEVAETSGRKEVELNIINPNEEREKIKLVQQPVASYEEQVRASKAFIAYPGGLGTHVRVLMAIQLMQVGHIQKCPIFPHDEKFWSGILRMSHHMLNPQLWGGKTLISPNDISLFQFFNDLAEIKPALDETLNEKEISVNIGSLAGKFFTKASNASFISDLELLQASLEQHLANQSTAPSVCFYGSARILDSHKSYKDFEWLAEQVASKGASVVSGGGPGLMDAPQRGAQKISNGSHRIGVRIQLPFEEHPSPYLSLCYTHPTFPTRINAFNVIMNGNPFVIGDGGYGTLFETFAQLRIKQVMRLNNHPRAEFPIILYGNGPLMDELDGYLKHLNKSGMIKDEEFKGLYVRCKTREAALKVITDFFESTF